MADGINYLKSVAALQAQESAEYGAGGPAVVRAAPPVTPPAQGPSAKPVIALVDDLVKAAKADGKGHQQVDAAIEKFCDQHFALNPAQGERVEALLKMAIHSAQQDGLTRNEALAAISQVGQTVNQSPALPAEAYVEAAKAAGTESHLAMGIARFLVEMDGGNGPKPVAASVDRSHEVQSDVSSRYSQTLNGIAQNFK